MLFSRWKLKYFIYGQQHLTVVVCNNNICNYIKFCCFCILVSFSLYFSLYYQLLVVKSTVCLISSGPIDCVNSTWVPFIGLLVPICWFFSVLLFQIVLKCIYNSPVCSKCFQTTLHAKHMSCRLRKVSKCTLESWRNCIGCKKMFYSAHSLTSVM